MRKKSCIVWAASGLVVAGFFSAAMASDIGKTVRNTCSTCHSTKRICMNIGYKSQDAWKSTIQTMVDKGSRLPGARIDEAAAYLAGLKPGTGTVCE